MILLLGIANVAFGSSRPYGYWISTGILFIGIISFVVAMFRACRGLARLTWIVSTFLFLCVGSWAYYDEFKIFNLRGSDATFQIKHHVSLRHGFYYGFLSFIGIWAVYFIIKWFILDFRKKISH